MPCEYLDTICYIFCRSAEILANFYSVHMDPKLHPDPDEFWPERFLDEKDGSLINTDTVIPFGVGEPQFITIQNVVMTIFHV